MSPKITSDSFRSRGFLSRHLIPLRSLLKMFCLSDGWVPQWLVSARDLNNYPVIFRMKPRIILTKAVFNWLLLGLSGREAYGSVSGRYEESLATRGSKGVLWKWLTASHMGANASVAMIGYYLIALVPQD